MQEPKCRLCQRRIGQNSWRNQRKYLYPWLPFAQLSQVYSPRCWNDLNYNICSSLLNLIDVYFWSNLCQKIEELFLFANYWSWAESQRRRNKVNLIQKFSFNTFSFLCNTFTTFLIQRLFSIDSTGVWRAQICLVQCMKLVHRSSQLIWHWSGTSGDWPHIHPFAWVTSTHQICIDHWKENNLRVFIDIVTFVYGSGHLKTITVVKPLPS